MLVIEAEQGERLRLGHVLGNYRLIRKLGEGGVGSVYEGEHVRLGRKMALKVLHPDVASAETIARFFNEARAVNEIKHPNILDVEDFVTAETGEHYLIMELLVGEDLRTVISRDGLLSPSRVTKIGEQVASALAAIHRAGIVHRDLKPDNIFLTKKDGEEYVKLLDFGIAKFLDEKQGLTRDGMTMGTPEYMAPEQILTSGKPGSQADIYSLGMMLYECLAGAPAFTATTTAAILRGHISDPVVPPSQRRGEQLPPVLESVVLKCLEKDPANRFKSADDVISALGSTRAVEVVRVTKPQAAVSPNPARKPPSRAVQMLPAFAMAAGALVLHMLPRDPEKKAVAAPPPPAPIVAAAPPQQTPAEPPAAPAPAPAKIDVTLLSKPAGADMYLGDEPLGQSPVTAAIPVSSTPIALVARFADGVEVTQTIVPDRPLPTITFDKPKAGTPVARTRPKAPTTPPPAAKPAGKLNREGTIDPFK
ncbi:MAG: serine/threonine protein kinase [Deltaproteobacteria bacterium]|nr:serine/threonine protein kinase [Deltaproteobacteria bacterium]